MKPEDASPVDLPPTPAVAGTVFADQLPLAEEFVGHLATTGVRHGLIGPREVPRLWERHVLNCAVISDLLPAGAAVIDIGSGAGLPGVCLAIRRPDLQVTLVEPLLRRVTWLTSVLEAMGLDRVVVRRARAEEVAGELTAAFVTARAVAPLERLARWGLPLLEPGGSMVAIKGSSAQDEVDAAAALLTRAGCAASVITVGEGLLVEPTVVVRLDRGPGELTGLSPASSTPKKARRARPRR
ncbi:16S rRNA (guanine(527)-N(7))-methyltransferase RsmG [Angustibacter luteus]|uniref:Ribosomal RNA small subunit methyltransferase G n=1 Tax=Angustibacter luteus TaxID=658456 RepID=A0ABW1JDL2_9ACTN